MRLLQLDVDGGDLGEAEAQRAAGGAQDAKALLVGQAGHLALADAHDVLAGAQAPLRRQRRVLLLRGARLPVGLAREALQHDAVDGGVGRGVAEHEPHPLLGEHKRHLGDGAPVRSDGAVLLLLRLLRLLRRWMSLAARRVLCAAALVSVVCVSDCV